VLYAARADAYLDELSEKGLARLEAYYGFMRAFWRSEDPRYQTFFTSDIVPAASPEIVAALDEVRRRSISPENAVRAFDTILRIDVRDLLPQISVPTLVLQPSRGSAVTLATAREVAARIPNARLVVLDVDNHLIQEYEPGWPVLLEETWRFLGVDLSADCPNEHQATLNGAGLSAREQAVLRWDEQIPVTAGGQAPARNGLLALTVREREILAQIAGGTSNGEIAEHLCLSTRTVERHARNIYTKLGVHNRVAAANWAREHGGA
jgi:DNA-binding CsgD family transcriptional regulator